MPDPAGAGELRIAVAGLRSPEGVVRVAVCPEGSFTRSDCPWTGTAPAARPGVVVTGLPEGVYAVQAFHDEDSNGDLNRRGLRLREGIAFSNDAPMRFGPPRFRDAAVRVGAAGGRLTLLMRYYE
ncbi:DUF2141 domain-containing protein [Jannaschia formosa]|nr:DUF2141 domain-containing protein [Jannaschia formosa]